jgi:hypothetical protein
MLKNGKVVVHCQAGIGRTGTMGLAYWINRGLTLAEALLRIRKDHFPSLCADQQDCIFAFEKELAPGPPEPIDAVCFDFQGTLADGGNRLLYPEMADLVRELHERRVLLSIASSADPRAIRERLGAFGKLFDGIYYAKGGQKHHAIEEFILAAQLKDRSRIAFVDDAVENIVPAMERGPVYGIAFQKGVVDDRTRRFCQTRSIPFAASPEELRRYLFSRPG